MPEFEIKDQSIEVDKDQVIAAFQKTVEDDWKNRPGHDPYHFIVIEEEQKPVKAVFRNLENYYEDFSFTTHDAERVFSKLGFELKEKNIRSCLLEVLREYQGAKREEFAGHPLKEVIKEEIPALIKRTIDTENISVKGSAGKGHWADTPYIAIMDTRETTSPQEGIYVDYLFRSEEGKLYLTIDQGFTDIVDRYGRREGRKKLREQAEDIKKDIDTSRFSEGFPDTYHDDNMASAAKAVYKEYDLDDFPDNDELKEDLRNIVSQYTDYINRKEFSYNQEPESETVSGKIYKATGWPDHWLTSYNREVWGLEEKYRSRWEKISEGDIILIHSTGKDSHGNRYDSGIIGYAVVGGKTTKKVPWWRQEKEEEKNSWPLIIEFKETHWLGNVDKIQKEEIDRKSESQIKEECEALVQKNVGFKEIEDRLNYNFPAMGSVSTVKKGEEILSMVQEKLNPKNTLNDHSSVDLQEELQINLNTSVLEGLYFPENEDSILKQIQAAINSGKHIIFTGPPGTGKTEIANKVSEHLAENEDLITGYQITTATSDWSTFDTVGGYMPEKDGGGDLNFNPGQILNRFREGRSQTNELLVIDEINRADIDKAFGQLFTVLSGQQVQLPYEAENGKEIELWPAENDGAPDTPGDHQYIIPASWRILATMNTYDKTSLYEMSYAFMRRFAFIRIDAPEAEDIDEDMVNQYIQRWNVEPYPENVETVAEIWAKTNGAVEGRKIGPSIVKDMLTFIQNGGSPTKAVTNYIFPQLEGVRKNKQIVSNIADAENVESNELKQTARDMLQVKFDEEE